MLRDEKPSARIVDYGNAGPFVPLSATEMENGVRVTFPQRIEPTLRRLDEMLL
jgi:hypothetical protein